MSTVRGRNGFSLFELLVAIGVLALATLVGAQIVGNRPDPWDRTAAMQSAPAAMDALTASLQGDELHAVRAMIVNGEKPKRFIYMSRNAAMGWRVEDLTADSPLPADVDGPLYIAQLKKMSGASHPAAPLDLRVDIDWLMPSYAGEDEADFRERIRNAQPLCTYPLLLPAR